MNKEALIASYSRHKTMRTWMEMILTNIPWANMIPNKLYTNKKFTYWLTWFLFEIIQSDPQLIIVRSSIASNQLAKKISNLLCSVKIKKLNMNRSYKGFTKPCDNMMIFVISVFKSFYKFSISFIFHLHRFNIISSNITLEFLPN